VTQTRFDELIASLWFAFASLLTAIMSTLAFGAVLARNHKTPNHNGAFLADKQRALGFYRVFSAAYDILNPHLYTDFMRNEIVARIGSGKGMRVLDVGCGTGYTTSGILKLANVCEVTGVDMNPVQLNKAARNLHAEKLRTSLSRGDAENLPFQDGAFDAVISVGAIEYFPDPKHALREMARVTKPYGKVVVCGPEAKWFAQFRLDKVFYTPPFGEVEGLFSGAELREVKSELTGLKTVFGTDKYVVVAWGTK
jgi:ubiquinone/menaquinone biosynthesis C-methylase UbiE